MTPCAGWTCVTRLNYSSRCPVCTPLSSPSHPIVRRLAVFATGSAADQAGIYLVTLATGDFTKVFALADAHSLLWSPDGEFLALTGVAEDGADEQVLVLHLRSRQIAFQADPLPSGAALPLDWPIANWGLAFPVAPGDLQTCSNPPLE